MGFAVYHSGTGELVEDSDGNAVVFEEREAADAYSASANQAHQWTTEVRELGDGS